MPNESQAESKADADKPAAEASSADGATSDAATGDAAGADNDGVIHVMPEQLANQIAAGEVVQRPASVAKELIENAVDAGAQSIQLILKDAGSTLVQVIDDGCGMSRADAVRCFERHATSKVQSIEDLERIRTLGFRGEALASIAAVAQVELKTKRTEDDVGTRVRVKGGDVKDVAPCAAPNGTSVAVRNLFYNVPARRNFLKTPATEFKHLADVFQRLALANPDIAFELQHKGRTVYDVAAQGGDRMPATRQRVIDLLGEEHEGVLVPVEDESSYLSVRGFVSTPAFTRKTRGEQFLFVNGRYFEDRYQSHAVKKAYGDALPDGAFPFFALFLDLDGRHVDVNVHPTKTEVKFDDKSGVYGFLRSAVQRALREAHQTPSFEASPSEGEEGPSTSPDAAQAPDVSASQRGEDGEGSASRDRSTGNGGPPSFQPRRRTSDGSSDARGRTRTERGSDANASDTSNSPSGSGAGASSPRPSARGGRSSPGATGQELYRGREDEEAGRGEASDEASDETRAGAEHEGQQTTEAPGERGPRQRPLWSLHDTYLLTPTREGVLVVDQRAAHLRVLYETALHNLKNEPADAQRLLFSHTVDLPAADAELFEELKPDLRALGFDVERLSGRTVAVRGVPPSVSADEEREALEGVLEQYKTDPGSVGRETKKRLAQSLAQQQAVRRGQPLAPDEQRALLQDLFACEMPYADPQGRPTTWRLSMEEIAKQFDR